MSDHLVKDKYVIFDFYADWCGPCRQLTPQLESFVARYSDRVALRKVDIVRWGTPVARQYNVNSIPLVKVYNRRGREVHSASGGSVLGYLEKLARDEKW